ncbi:DNA -binding domain-containing protein [Novosphingobium sp.]|uniref:DNA -binding domain-containing protein n=1 Tax=Novosphingobium sp. TaxID=1874826 RepID=UPI002FDD9271
MTKEDFLDQPPGGAALTAYDQAHLKLYLRLLDAEAEGADWKEVVEVLFGICAKSEPERAARVHTSHLARAKWMTENGFGELLGPRLH